MVVIGCTSVIVCDIFRHALVLNSSPLREVVDYGMKNPLTGNALRLTNHALSEALYFASVVFAAQIVWCVGKTHLGSQTTMLASSFVLMSKEEVAREDEEGLRLRHGFN